MTVQKITLTVGAVAAATVVGVVVEVGVVVVEGRKRNVFYRALIAKKNIKIERID